MSMSSALAGLRNGIRELQLLIKGPHYLFTPPKMGGVWQVFDLAGGYQVRNPHSGVHEIGT
jgi:hypothetical protein